mgnify:CR=1 FL=1
MIIGFWIDEILFCEYTKNILNEWRREREAQVWYCHLIYWRSSNRERAML